jgi:hypothetical protein
MTTNRSGEELAMRALIVPELRKRYPSARIIHELPLRYSSNRIDLAAVTETEIISVEIKSSRDSLDRLEGQLRAFQPISARIITALAPKMTDIERQILLNQIAILEAMIPRGSPGPGRHPRDPAQALPRDCRARPSTFTPQKPEGIPPPWISRSR